MGEFLPKIYRCPCCNKIHLAKLNGLVLENKFKSLKDFTIKKQINCGRCNAQFSIMVHDEHKEIKIIWDEYYKIYDDHILELEDLQAQKVKLEIEVEEREKFIHKQNAYEKLLKEINNVQNSIRQKQAKLRIKARLIHPKAIDGIEDRLVG